MIVDIDDTIIEVHGYRKQGLGYGNSGVRGINAAIVTVSTKLAAPVVIAQRMHKVRPILPAAHHVWSPPHCRT